MKVINWRAWLLDPLKKHEEKDAQKGDLLWADPVTGVRFSILKQEYDQLLALAKQQLAMCTGDEAFARLTALPYPFGDSVAAKEIAYHIPFPRPKEFDGGQEELPVLCRLVDFLLVRSSLYFALFTPSVDDWALVRTQLLRVEPQFQSDLISDQVNAIDHYLTDGHVEDRWKEQKLAVVKAGAVKIKEYFLETDNIKEIRGASRLLEEISQQRIPRYVEDVATPESVVYSGGGKVLIVLPLEQGREVARGIESLYSKVTGSAQAVAFPMVLKWEELSEHLFSRTLQWMEWKRTERQMVKGPQVEQNDLDIAFYSKSTRKNEMPALGHTRDQYLHFLKSGQKDTASLLVKGSIPICTSCRLREANEFVRYSDLDWSAYCTPCHHKALSGNDESEELFLQDISQLAKQYKFEMFSNSDLTIAKDLDDIADQSASKDLIAVVYGDGNNMGQVVDTLDGFLKYRYFSVLSDQVTKLATYTTLLEAGKLFEVIAVGGDDVFLVVPGSEALGIARKIGERFDQALSTYRGPEKVGITMSVGVAIGSSKSPFFILYRTAVELLKSAKEAKKSRKANWVGGSVDFMLQRHSNPFTEGLKQFRAGQYMRDVQHLDGTPADMRLLMRPYTFDQVRQMEELLLNLREIKGARGVLYHLCHLLQHLSLEEMKLYYHNYMFAGRDREGQRAKLHKWVSKFVPENMVQDVLFFSPRGTGGIATEFVSPWHDLSELWSVYEGRERSRDEA